MPPKGKGSGNGNSADTAYRHSGEKRKNVPLSKIAGQGQVPKVAKAVYAYSPHLSPVLRFDGSGKADRALEMDELLALAAERPLTEEERARIKGALPRIRESLRAQQPWLEWAQKREQHERGALVVEPVALHIHERVSAQAIVRAAMREDVQRDLFADPQQPLKEAVKFYKHEVDWANRLILGDSLQVMASLAKREGLAGKVQMIYMDPPYGIKFGSNFQPEVGKRDVKDKESDLTREPEMVKAYRDTWTLGVHSYLSYLRDRLMVAKELLAETGSIFVQISDENLHRVRMLMDEVFGGENFVSIITTQKTAGQSGIGISNVSDYLLWYAKFIEQLKQRPLYHEKEIGGEYADEYRFVKNSNGATRSLSSQELCSPENIEKHGGRVFGFQPLVSQGYRANTSVPFPHSGKIFDPGKNLNWKTTLDGLARLGKSDRLIPRDTSLRYLRYLNDFPVVPLNNVWADTGAAGRPGEKVYVVQTNTKIVQRCLLMTTDPGDLVLDPTCGSGTTAYVAEQWGRRWITMDTSRVAIAIARQRFVTARFDHYKTKGEAPRSGFIYKTVPHITLKSIAQNPNLDPIFAKHEPLLDKALAGCNTALKKVPADTRKKLAAKLVEKQRAEGKRAITDADRRRWELPKDAFEHWTVPFDTDPDWPKPLQDAVTAYRKAWRSKMDEVDACIKANADQEDLVDQPEKVPGVVRVSGPFTVEGVLPEELNLGEDGLFDGTPNEFEQTFSGASDATPAYAAAPIADDPQNLLAYLTRMVQLLRQDGVTFPDNKHRAFARLDPLFESGNPSVLHAAGIYHGTDPGEPNNIAVTFGPQYGPVTAYQVEDLLHKTKRYDELIIAGFSFDAEATALIREYNSPRLKVHQVFIRPDVNPGMNGLLKDDSPRNQLFTVFGQPEIKIRKQGKGLFVCELKGVDIYDPLGDTIRSTGCDKVAAWFLDTDYDGRCFCVTQAFFPDKDAWGKIAQALKSHADEDAFAALAGTVSLPFPAGKHGRVAVKVIDPRGNEVMAIESLKE